MWMIDLENKVIHDMSRPQYECRITKIPKDQRKKIYTIDGVKRFLEDNTKHGFNGCRYCMPDYYDFDMTSIFRENKK